MTHSEMQPTMALRIKRYRDYSDLDNTGNVLEKEVLQQLWLDPADPDTNEWRDVPTVEFD